MTRIVQNNKNLSQWPAFVSNTTDIRIQNNQLTEIPDSIETLKQLTRIIAGENKISKI